MANPIVAFNDSTLGVILAVAFHTLGAVGLLGGLVAYVSWHRQLLHGHHNRRVLDLAATLTYVSILVNLIGGFARTFESDHPHLTEFGTSPWVRAVAIKHLFIFAAMGAAVYLLEGVARRHLRAFKAGTLPEEGMDGHRVGVAVVLLGILVAGALGGVAAAYPPVADTDMEEMEDHDEHDGTGGVRYVNATGQLTSTPVAPAESSGGFDVVDGTTTIHATFLYSPPAQQLFVDLQSPGAQLVTLAGSNGRAEATIEAPTVGAWTYTVRAELAIGAQWTLSLQLSEVAAGQMLMADRVVIAPGQFFEINTEADVGARLHWAWSADAAIHFDVHTHFDDEVQYVVEEQTDGSAGAYEVVRKGGHSYLWENTGVLPVALEYRAWGDWTLDSTFPPSA